MNFSKSLNSILASLILFGLACAFFIINKISFDEEATYGIVYVVVNLCLLPTFIYFVNKRISSLYLILWVIIRYLLFYYDYSQNYILQTGEINVLSNGDVHSFINSATYVNNDFNAIGVHLISSADAYNNSLSYLGVPYVWGFSSYIFGNFPYISVPILGFVHGLCAILIYSCLEKYNFSEKVCRYITLFMLFNPAWLLLNNQMFRDIFILAGIILLLLALVYYYRKKYVIFGLIFLIAILVQYLFRREFILISFMVSIIMLFIENKRNLFIIIPIVLVTLSSTLLFNQVAGTAISQAAGDLGAEYNSQKLMKFVGGINIYNAIILVPIRILVSTICPFPWTNFNGFFPLNVDIEYFYYLLFILQGIVNLAILYSWFMFLIKIGKIDFMIHENRLYLVVSIFLLATGFTSVGFFRYINDQIILLAPLLFRYNFRKSIMYAIYSIFLLHLVYFLF